MRLRRSAILWASAQVFFAWPSAGQENWKIDRIGSVELTIPAEGPGYLLSRIVGITALPGDLVAVLSADERMVRIFNAQGVLVRSLGREGAGPGEFKSPRALGHIGDSLWIWDFSLARVTVFRLNGRLEGTSRVLSSGRGYLLADGSMAIFPMRTYSPGGAGQNDTLLVRRVSREGGFTVSLARSAPYRVLTVGKGQGFVVGPQPFDDPPLLVPALDGSGFAVIDRPVATGTGKANIKVTRIGPRGDTLLTRTVSYVPVPVSSAMVAETVEWLANPTRGAATSAVKAAIEKQLFLPKFLPPVSAGLLGRDGSIWLRREEFAPGRTKHWTVLSAGRAAPIEVELDDRVLPFEVDGTILWATMKQEDGTSAVVRVRVTVPSAHRSG